MIEYAIGITGVLTIKADSKAEAEDLAERYLQDGVGALDYYEIESVEEYKING